MFRRLVLALAAVMLLCSPASAADKLVVAGDCNFPPFEYLNSKKEPIGYSMDYIKEVAKRAGLNIEIRNVAWDGIFAGLAAGNYDILASSTTITPERQKTFDFSTPYYGLTQAVILPKGKSMQSLADLKGKTVGSQIGITGVFVLRKANVGANIREYDDVGLAIADLASGRIDAVICDDPVAKYYANKRKDFEGKLTVAYQTGDKEYIGFCLKKGRKDLLDRINKAIEEIKKDGTEARLIEQWMGNK